MIFSRKGVPSAFIIVSVLYFIFVVSSGSSRMIGDEMSGDPGSMILPLVLSIAMFILSVYLFLKDKPAQGEPLTKDEKKIFVFTIFACILYVVLYRSVGFVLLSVSMLFLFTYVYSVGSVSLKDLKYGVPGLLLAIIIMLVLYSTGRFITRFLFQTARNSGIVLIGSAFTVFICNLVILTVLFLLIKKITSKVLHTKMATNPKIKTVIICVFVSIASIELLFLIFRQLFLVNLARGIINW